MMTTQVLLEAVSSARNEPFPLPEEVARLAYQKWSTRCQSSDHQLLDWLDAEIELAQLGSVAARLTETQEGLLRVLSEQREAERRLVAEHAVSSILAVAGSLFDAAPNLVQAIGECFAWDVGAVWIVEGDTGHLRCLEVWHPPQVSIPAFEEETRMRTYSAGIGLPGRVWASESIVWMPDVSAEPNFPRARVAAMEGLRSAIGFPIRNGNEFLGVLEFFSRDMREPDEPIAAMMLSIGGQISQFVERREVERRMLLNEQEHRIAREIQQGFLPNTMPRLSGFEISGKSMTANSVGGDCFDFIPLPGGIRDCLGVLIADASGHDMSAALLMGETRAFLRGLAMAHTDAGILLDLTNQWVSQDLESVHFVTALLVRLDASTRSLQFTGAGHIPGYVFDRHGQIKTVLRSSGIPLGIEPDTRYPASIVSLESGDLLLLMTDGVIEAASRDGELFGYDRALALVRQHRHRMPGEIISALFEAVRAFSEDTCHDDMTAVIVKVDHVA